MEISIRHQISDIEEEIYIFEIYLHKIRYVGYYHSFRDDWDDIWGYDWFKHTMNQKIEEISKLKELAYLYELDDDDLLLQTQYSDEYQAICDKYNPVLLKTIHGNRRLYGVYGQYLMKKHPPKLSIDQIKQQIKTIFSSRIDQAIIT